MKCATCGLDLPADSHPGRKYHVGKCSRIGYNERTRLRWQRRYRRILPASPSKLPKLDLDLCGIRAANRVAAAAWAERNPELATMLAHERRKRRIP